MTKKLRVIEDAVFHAQQNPKALARILEPLVTDVVSSVHINGADSIEVAASGGADSTSAFTGAAFSQYGDPMDNSVTLTLNEAVTGVSISNGTVTVVAGTSAESFVLKATCGTVTALKTVALTAAT